MVIGRVLQGFDCTEKTEHENLRVVRFEGSFEADLRTREDIGVQWKA